MRTRWIALLALGLAGCGASRAEAPLLVFAAASTTDVIEAAARVAPFPDLRSSFGASSTLARQIADGAPADLFLTAHRDWIDFLVEQGLVEGEPRRVCENRVVAVAPDGSRLALDPPAGLPELAASLTSTDRVALGSEGVPVGEHAREALRAAGVWEALAPWQVGFPDARAVARAAELGQVAVAFVYESDASIGAVTTLFTLAQPVQYWGAVLKGGARPDQAREFLSFLLAAEGRDLFQRAGFRTAEM